MIEFLSESNAQESANYILMEISVTNPAALDLPRDFANDISNLPSTAIRIYIFFLNNADEKDKVTASYQLIMEGTGIKQKNTIFSGLYNLILRGWVVDVKHGFNKSNIYKISKSAKPNQELIDKIIVRSSNRKRKDDLVD